MSVEGLIRLPGLFALDEQRQLLRAVETIAREAPFSTPTLKNGQPLRLTLTSAGVVGWWGDTLGYRYILVHPSTGERWPSIPAEILDAVKIVLRAARERYAIGPLFVDTCLINRYGQQGALGLHCDQTEDATEAPIVSISLGAPCSFAVAGFAPGDKIVERMMLQSGDALVMAGPARQRFHAVERLLSPMFGEQEIVLPGLLNHGERLNLTIRQVFKRDAPR